MSRCERKEKKNKEQKSLNNKNKTKVIVAEYRLKLNSFFPNNKSPNFFVKKLEYRMKQYYDVYSSQI
jgi:hypothetical protein